MRILPGSDTQVKIGLILHSDDNFDIGIAKPWSDMVYSNYFLLILEGVQNTIKDGLLF